MFHYDSLHLLAVEEDLQRPNVIAELLVKRDRRCISFDVAAGGEHPPGAERIVSSAEYFMAGDREGPQTVGRSRSRWRQYERRLRLVELARDELHRGVVECIRINDHRKRIPPQGLGGKDIGPVEFDADL